MMLFPSPIPCVVAATPKTLSLGLASKSGLIVGAGFVGDSYASRAVFLVRTDTKDAAGVMVALDDTDVYLPGPK